MLQEILTFPYFSVIVVPILIIKSSSFDYWSWFSWLTWWFVTKAYPDYYIEMRLTTYVRRFFLLASLIAFLLDELLPLASMIFGTEIGVEGQSGRRRLKLRPREFKVVAWAVLNILISNYSFALYEICSVHVLHRQSILSVTSSRPSERDTDLRVASGLIIWGISTYVIHRFILHNPFFYFFEYPHRTWYHGLGKVYPMKASYDHPVVYFIHRVIPLYLPLVLIRFHALQWVSYLAIVTYVETFSDAGYGSVPPLPLLKAIGIRILAILQYIRRLFFGPGTTSTNDSGIKMPRQSNDDTQGINGNKKSRHSNGDTKGINGNRPKRSTSTSRSSRPSRRSRSRSLELETLESILR